MRPAPDSTASGGRRLQGASIVVAAVFLALTVTFAAITQVLHAHTEARLLERLAVEAGAVLTSAISGVDRPLATAAELAEATDGAAAEFEAVMTRAIGDGQFAAAALYDVDSAAPLVTVGQPTVFDAAGAVRVQDMVDQALAPTGSPYRHAGSPRRRLGYAFRAAQENPRYVVYAEQPLPEQRTGAPPASGAFREIAYAL